MMLTVLQFILLRDIATTFFYKIHEQSDFSKKSEKKKFTFSARNQTFHFVLISRPNFCYTGFTELYVLVTGDESERLPDPICPNTFTKSILCVTLEPTFFEVSFPEVIMNANVITSLKHQISITPTTKKRLKQT